MKRKELFSMIGVILVSIGTVFLFSGCVTDFNGLFFGKEDTDNFIVHFKRGRLTGLKTGRV